MKLLTNFAKYIINIIPGYSWIVGKNELSFYVPFSKIDQILFFLKKHTHSQFTILIDICGVDYPMRGRFRYDIVYHILSIRFNTRLRLKIAVQDLTMVPSVVKVYSSANWWEREVFDMFGLFFSDHPDLRRILTDYGFVGHPLKKDFPLMGFVEVRYDFAKKQILAENVELSQDFRQYNFENPWNSGFISSFKVS